MPGDIIRSPLLRTKFHRPPIPSDHVHRARLVEQIVKCCQRPLTLVSAPAGYGKSILVSSWLENCDLPSAWVSLDENDNSLNQFLSYFLAAVEILFPNGVSETMALVNAPTSPPQLTLLSSLASELDSIGQDFILVLDDSHFLREQSIHHFLNDLLRHPPRSLHLVLICRRDPLLNITAFRARNQLGEIRLQDLRFTVDETATYLQQIFKKKIDGGSATAWFNTTEGWVTGLRLAALALLHRGDVTSIPPEFQRGSQYVMEYFFNEVLLQQAPEFVDYLLKTSIVDRFCAPLGDAIVGIGVKQGKSQQGGRQFIDLLKKENLFLISLDNEDRWFRYHHLFQDLLKRRLQQKYPVNTIKKLHLVASEWFEYNGLFTESIKHALLTGEAVSAARIVERYRHYEFTADRWGTVEQWLAMLPAGIKLERPILLLAAAWIENLKHNLARVPMLLDQAESLLKNTKVESTVLAEIAFFRGYISYFEGQGRASLQYLESAVSQFAGTKSPFLADAELMRGLARYMVGRKESAIQALEVRINEVDPSEVYLRSRLIAGLAFIYLTNGDLYGAGFEAQRLQRVAKKNNMRLTEAWSYYFSGCINLHLNNLEAASSHFAQTYKLRYVMEPRGAVDAMTGLVLTQQLMGLSDEADASYRRLEEFTRELHENSYLSVAKSCQARLSLLRGELVSAVELGRVATDLPVMSELFLWLEAPIITQARVLIAAGTEQSLSKAVRLLKSIRDTCEVCRLECQTIEVAVLQSLALVKQRRVEEALVALQDAVVLAEPGGWIRPFVEAGPPMVDLLKRLRKHKVAVDYVERVLSVFRDKEGAVVQDAAEPQAVTTPSAKPQALVEPLTYRELDVLELLAQRLQNKEIAEKLVISTATVKSHLERIYQKLNVNKRREAVEKANVLKIIDTR